jgi:hypothetical protein
VLLAARGQPRYGQPLGLVLDQGAGEVRALAGVLDSVPERTGGVMGRILVVRLADAQDVRG